MQVLDPVTSRWDLATLERKHEEDLAKNSGNYYGKVKSNFVGTEFVMHDKGVKPADAEQTPLRFRVDPQTISEFVKNHTELPLEVSRFGTQVTL